MELPRESSAGRVCKKANGLCNSQETGLCACRLRKEGACLLRAEGPHGGLEVGRVTLDRVVPHS